MAALTIQQLEEYYKDPNVRAFLDVIADYEGTRRFGSNDGYDVQYTGKTFAWSPEGPSRHPHESVRGSTAAGRYQFLGRTWDGLDKQYGFGDFSPRSQNLGAIALIHGRGALDDVRAGRFDKARALLKDEWTSFGGGGPPSGGGGPASLDSQVWRNALPSFSPGALFGPPSEGGGLLSFRDPATGQSGLAAPSTDYERDLLPRFAQMDEEVRGKLLSIHENISQAERPKKDLFDPFPDYFDDRILALLDQDDEES